MSETDTTITAPAGHRATEPAAGPTRGERYARYGGFSFAAVCFGWLVSVAMPLLLAGLVAGLAAAVGASFDVSRADARDQAATIGVTAGVVVLVLVAIGYFAGGYVAGRMTRFDAGRQGVGVWALSLLASMAVTVAGAALSMRFDVAGVPAFALPDGAFDARGIFVFAVVALTTLLLAFLGARAGQRHHAQIDG